MAALIGGSRKCLPSRNAIAIGLKIYFEKLILLTLNALSCMLPFPPPPPKKKGGGGTKTQGCSRIKTIFLTPLPSDQKSTDLYAAFRYVWPIDNVQSVNEQAWTVMWLCLGYLQVHITGLKPLICTLAVGGLN